MSYVVCRIKSYYVLFSFFFHNVIRPHPELKKSFHERFSCRLIFNCQIGKTPVVLQLSCKQFIIINNHRNLENYIFFFEVKILFLLYYIDRWKVHNCVILYDG